MDYLQHPRTVRRFQLKHDAGTIRSAGGCHPVEIAMLVKNHRGARARSIVAAGEAMNHGLGPHPARIGQLKNYAAPALTRSTTTRHRSAIEIAVSIKSDALVPFATIRAPCKIVDLIL